MHYDINNYCVIYTKRKFLVNGVQCNDYFYSCSFWDVLVLKYHHLVCKIFALEIQHYFLGFRDNMGILLLVGRISLKHQIN